MRTHTLRVFALAVFALLLTSAANAQTPQKPWPIRAVIVTTFEIGNDTGDTPGEFQFWVEREHLTETLPFPGGAGGPNNTARPIRTNPDHTILGIVSGTTLVNSTASLMALGLDPRFDLTHAYILINGIAGVDPQIASIGSAAWANYVVNDVAREIDPREAPADWPYGIFPSGASRPDPNARPHHHLDPLQPLHPQPPPHRLGLRANQRPSPRRRPQSSRLPCRLHQRPRRPPPSLRPHRRHLRSATTTGTAAS